MDIQFKKPELEDREYINSYIHKQCSRSCEYTFANIYLWSRLYPVEYGTVENMVVFKTLDGENMFAFPMGEPQYLKGPIDSMSGNEISRVTDRIIFTHGRIPENERGRDKNPE